MRKVDEKERDMELFTIRENRVETQIRGKKEKNEGRKGKINRTTVERFGCFRKKEKKEKFLTHHRVCIKSRRNVYFKAQERKPH